MVALVPQSNFDFGYSWLKEIRAMSIVFAPSVTKIVSFSIGSMICLRVFCGTPGDLNEPNCECKANATNAISPTTLCSIASGELLPISSACVSTWTNLTFLWNLGASPKCRIQFILAPNKTITSEFINACDLAEETFNGFES
ncbi:hypothetical protein WICPIJ_001595 [Wickerhamomyces pijperi]|uniref:Uncharacterized protein n=1 Tax=Wickerhamomyces pijperi TaxID=599730 RepID=A0A9P8QBB8_WICPI|nr:hypothetical protein WICPIJ_001595 [Wickerhamomyces pijperi]